MLKKKKKTKKLHQEVDPCKFPPGVMFLCWLHSERQENEAGVETDCSHLDGWKRTFKAVRCEEKLEEMGTFIPGTSNCCFVFLKKKTNSHNVQLYLKKKKKAAAKGPVDLLALKTMHTTVRCVVLVFQAGVTGQVRVFSECLIENLNNAKI